VPREERPAARDSRKSSKVPDAIKRRSAHASSAKTSLVDTIVEGGLGGRRARLDREADERL